MAVSAVEAKALLRHFPAVRYAVGYGSGIMRQDGHSRTKNTMVDMIFAVEDAESWHAANIERHASHYSGLRWFGPRTVAAVQRKFGAKVYFNPLVRLDGVLIKYGVVTVDDMAEDLRHWESLYLAGRLHKPVVELQPDADIAEAQAVNKAAALNAALLLLPHAGGFAETDIYTAIAGLSYHGDPRMSVGEDPRKIQRIVAGSLPDFQSMYRPALEEKGLRYESGKEALSNPSQGQKYQWLELLPRTVRDRMFAKLGPLRDDVDVERHLHATLADIVRSASLSQSVKGIFTAGLQRSVIYAWEKVQKKLNASKGK